MSPANVVRRRATPPERSTIQILFAYAKAICVALTVFASWRPGRAFFAAVLFGALLQGGTELSFDMPHINRDLIVVRNCVMLLAAMVVTVNFVVDVLYAFIDPRIKVHNL